MAQGTCASGWDNAEFLSVLESATLRHRKARAAKLRGQGQARKSELRRLGFSEEYVERSSRWYVQRAEGQLMKFEKVADCGQDSIRVICQCCGVVVDRPVQCRLKLLCVRCRSARAREDRARFILARSKVIEDAKRRGLLNQSRPRGQWTEKFITLTVPHLPKDTVELRIGRAAAAWPEFLRRLNGWLRSIDAAKSSHWFRVLEWTPGESDDFGHPHFHLWFFGPFIPIDYLREWWRESLESLGVSFNGNHPIVHPGHH